MNPLLPDTSGYDTGTRAERFFRVFQKRFGSKTLIRSLGFRLLHNRAIREICSSAACFLKKWVFDDRHPAY
ncbi:hypothetical protein [Paenibacillus sp. UNC499MF]|uniref:hypothetical protein n=1 Tax=Paenibacillus sp. UNC499MF TaxID=1502751 RepID=UPI000CDEDF79|nr:hypothetical protein [Paenibacillus sp. UNC499MF]